MDLLKRLRITFVASIAISLLLLWVFTSTIKLPVLFGLGLAIWIILSTLQNALSKHWSRKQLGMVVAHLGVAICIIGIAMTTSYSITREVRMKLGDTITIQPYQFTFETIQDKKGPNYDSAVADILVTKNKAYLTTLHPEKRFYRVQTIATSKAAIAVSLFRDLYVALGEPIGNDSWSMRIYYKPFIRWIWYGGLLILLGGLLACVRNSGNRTTDPCS